MQHIPQDYQPIQQIQQPQVQPVAQEYSQVQQQQVSQNSLQQVIQQQDYAHQHVQQLQYSQPVQQQVNQEYQLQPSQQPLQQAPQDYQQQLQQEYQQIIQQSQQPMQQQVVQQNDYQQVHKISQVHQPDFQVTQQTTMIQNPQVVQQQYQQTVPQQMVTGSAQQMLPQQNSQNQLPGPQTMVHPNVLPQQQQQQHYAPAQQQMSSQNLHHMMDQHPQSVMQQYIQAQPQQAMDQPQNTGSMSQPETIAHHQAVQQAASDTFHSQMAQMGQEVGHIAQQVMPVQVQPIFQQQQSNAEMVNTADYHQIVQCEQEDHHEESARHDDQQQKQVSPGMCLAGPRNVCCGDLPFVDSYHFSTCFNTCPSSQMSISTPSLPSTLVLSRSSPAFEQMQRQALLQQQHLHAIHSHHHHPRLFHNHLACQDDCHSHHEIDSGSKLLSPNAAVEAMWHRKASLPGAHLVQNTLDPPSNPDALLRRGSLPLTPASGQPILLLHPQTNHYKCHHLPTSDYCTSSNHSTLSGSSIPPSLMRRSSSGSITLPPLREGTTSLNTEDCFSQVDTIPCFEDLPKIKQLTTSVMNNLVEVSVPDSQ
jgi:hypothetical protein